MFTCQWQGEDWNIDARVPNCRDKAILIVDALMFVVVFFHKKKKVCYIPSLKFDLKGPFFQE